MDENQHNSLPSTYKALGITVLIVVCLLMYWRFVTPASSDTPQEEQAPEQPQTTQAVQDERVATEQTYSSSDELFANLDITQAMHDEFVHGPKPAEYQRYVVLHDTEGEGNPENIISYWVSNEKRIAAHFVIGKDGHIAQSVPLDKIAHHVGFGDSGHNERYGVTDESRDDKVGTTPIGKSFADYGMNSYSIGIELVHVGNNAYPEAQLKALDALIAYLDAYYQEQGLSNAGTIIDHKAWRSGNSDTSSRFAAYLVNYQERRTHE